MDLDTNTIIIPVWSGDSYSGSTASSCNRYFYYGTDDQYQIYNYYGGVDKIVTITEGVSMRGMYHSGGYNQKQTKYNRYTVI